ncbi:MAG: class II glutamine amidotransferase [Caulobacterales bacterium]|nr:class II glutamine amidotransferase [Caulobacterales bacterium]
MCRMLGYLGAPVLLDDLLYAPDSSLLKQTVDAQMLSMLNLAGFGFAAWSDQWQGPDAPLCYRSTQVAVFDKNIQAMAKKLSARALVAHLRGVPYHAATQVNLENVHPFNFEGLPLVLAHNGDLAAFSQMRFDLVEHVRPEFRRLIMGSSDSAWLYALVVSQLESPAGPNTAEALVRAVERTLAIVRQVRERHGIRRSSSVNLILGDGRNLVAVRFTFDFGVFDVAPFQGGVEFLSAWYTLGRDYGLKDGEWKMVAGPERADSVIVASEPLTRDVATWVEVPEYSALMMTRDEAGCHGRVVALDV